MSFEPFDIDEEGPRGPLSGQERFVLAVVIVVIVASVFARVVA